MAASRLATRGAEGQLLLGAPGMRGRVPLGCVAAALAGSWALVLASKSGQPEWEPVLEPKWPACPRMSFSLRASFDDAHSFPITWQDVLGVGGVGAEDSNARLEDDPVLPPLPWWCIGAVACARMKTGSPLRDAPGDLLQKAMSRNRAWDVWSREAWVRQTWRMPLSTRLNRVHARHASELPAGAVVEVATPGEVNASDTLQSSGILDSRGRWRWSARQAAATALAARKAAPVLGTSFALPPGSPLHVTIILADDWAPLFRRQCRGLGEPQADEAESGGKVEDVVPNNTVAGGADSETSCPPTPSALSENVVEENLGAQCQGGKDSDALEGDCEVAESATTSTGAPGQRNRTGVDPDAFPAAPGPGVVDAPGSGDAVACDWASEPLERRLGALTWHLIEVDAEGRERVLAPLTPGLPLQVNLKVGSALRVRMNPSPPLPGTSIGASAPVEADSLGRALDQAAMQAGRSWSGRQVPRGADSGGSWRGPVVWEAFVTGPPAEAGGGVLVIARCDPSGQAAEGHVAFSATETSGAQVPLTTALGQVTSGHSRTRPLEKSLDESDCATQGSDCVADEESEAEAAKLAQLFADAMPLDIDGADDSSEEDLDADEGLDSRGGGGGHGMEQDPHGASTQVWSLQVRSKMGTARASDAPEPPEAAQDVTLQFPATLESLSRNSSGSASISVWRRCSSHKQPVCPVCGGVGVIMAEQERRQCGASPLSTPASEAWGGRRRTLPRDGGRISGLSAEDEPEPQCVGPQTSGSFAAASTSSRHGWIGRRAPTRQQRRIDAAFAASLWGAPGTHAGTQTDGDPSDTDAEADRPRCGLHSVGVAHVCQHCLGTGLGEPPEQRPSDDACQLHGVEATVASITATFGPGHVEAASVDCRAAGHEALLQAPGPLRAMVQVQDDNLWQRGFAPSAHAVWDQGPIVLPSPRSRYLAAEPTGAPADILSTHTISLDQALSGWGAMFALPSGDLLFVEHSGETMPGDFVIVSGAGLPRWGGSGSGATAHRGPGAVCGVHVRISRQGQAPQPDKRVRAAILPALPVQPAAATEILRPLVGESVAEDIGAHSCALHLPKQLHNGSRCFSRHANSSVFAWTCGRPAAVSKATVRSEVLCMLRGAEPSEDEAQAWRSLTEGSLAWHGRNCSSFSNATMGSIIRTTKDLQTILRRGSQQRYRWQKRSRIDFLAATRSVRLDTGAWVRGPCMDSADSADDVVKPLIPVASDQSPLNCTDHGSAMIQMVVDFPEMLSGTQRHAFRSALA